MREILDRLNSVGGKVFYRLVSIIPITLFVVLARKSYQSLVADAYLTAAILLIPLVLLAWLIRFLWSSKRTLGDIVEANS